MSDAGISAIHTSCFLMCIEYLLIRRLSVYVPESARCRVEEAHGQLEQECVSQ